MSHPRRPACAVVPAADVSEDAGAPVSGSCPFDRDAAAAPGVGRDDRVVLPLHKRVVVQYAAAAGGGRELHLYCDAKEVVFDEPDLFAFGEALARHSSFVAGDCTRWGEGYQWPRVQELLQQLVAEGVLLHGADAAVGPDDGPQGKDQPAPLPPAPSARARSWDECEHLTRELAGRAVEPGYLELVVPVFRVAHIALDAEGRQVGEANVFPRPLRVEVPTRWRTCIYPGTRYLDDKPMNVSALKAMRSHWPQVMAALLRIRQAYMERFPAARSLFTLGDAERLATLVLAVATYPLLKKNDRVGSGQLHPVLSSMFRVTDGLRMTTHQMLFVPVAEATLSPDSPVTAAQIHGYAERNYSFHSAQGVCAGPSVMVDQFLRLLIEGAGGGQFASVALDDAVERALTDMQPAFDYGLLGLQAFAVVFSSWPVMTRTYDRLARIVGDWSGPRSAALERLHGWLQQTAAVLRNETFHATEEWRANRERVYADIHAQCGAGLGDAPGPSLTQRLTGVPGEQHRAAAERLRAVLRRRCSVGPGADAGDVDGLVDCLMHSFVRMQQILCLACETQWRINTLLQREPPRRPFSAADVDVHVLLQGDEARRLPHLLPALERLLGLRVTITRERVAIRDAIWPDSCTAERVLQDCRHGAGNIQCDMHDPERQGPK